MMQVENEYGSYGEDKDYLRAIRDLMKEKGVTCPLFTSDGPWRATLRAGTLIEEDLFVTGNFGSKAAYNFGQMKEFFDEYGKRWPLDVYGILGWLVYPLERTCDSKGTQRSWLKLSMRSWSLAPLISTCFMAEPILAS